MKRSSVAYHVTLIVLQLQAILLTMGVITGTALLTDSLGPIIHVAVVQAIALAVASVVNLAETRRGAQARHPSVFLVIGSLASVGAATLQVQSAGWFAVLLLRLVCGQYPLARLAAMGNDVIAKPPAVVAKRIQMLQAAANMTGFVVGPILFSRLSFAYGFWLDAGALAVSACLMARMYRGFPAQGATTSVTLRPMIDVLAATIPPWVMLGFANVAETQYLKRAFGVTPEIVSAVFLVTGIAGLTTALTAPARWVGRWHVRIAFASGVALIASCVALFATRSIYGLFVVSAVIGCGNALLNMAIQARVQGKETLGERSSGMIAARLVVQAGTLAGAAFLATVSPTLLDPIPMVTLALGCFAAITLSYLAPGRIASIVGGLGIMIVATALVSTGAVSAADQRPPAFLESVRVPVRRIPQDLDPATVADASSALVEHQIYQGLYDYSDSNVLRPVLAKRHTLSTDGKTIVISVDRSRRFSDGTPLTAPLVRDSLVSTLKILGEKARWAFGGVEGFDAFVASKGASDLGGLVARGDDELVVRFGKPSPHFLQILTAPNFVISVMHGGRRLGTGAYLLSQREATTMTLTLRPDLAATNPAPRKVEFVAAPGLTETLELAREGRLDVLQSPQAVRTELPGMRSTTFSFLQAIMLVLNTKSAAFSDAGQRCAVARTLREALGPEVVDWEKTSRGLPYGWGFFDDRRPKEPAACANHAITVDYASSAALFANDTFDRLQVQLAKSACPMSFRKRDVGDLFARLDSGAFDAAIIGFIPDYLDPDALLYPVLKTGQQYNWSRVSDPTIDALLDLGRELVDQGSRLAVFRQILDRVETTCPVAFLGSQQGILFYSERLARPEINGMGLHMLDVSSLRPAGKAQKGAP